MTRFFLLIGLTMLCGCTKHAYLVNAAIPLNCIHKPVRELGCTPDLLRCKKFEITHDKGCELIDLK